MSVIELAEKRRDDPSNEEYQTRYWAAFLEGAIAQAKEDIKKMNDHLDSKDNREIRKNECHRCGKPIKEGKEFCGACEATLFFEE